MIDFIGNFVYIDGVLEWNTFDEGRVVYPSTGVCFFENHVKDHLGNVRVTYSKNGTIANARDVYAYYPFGMGINSLSATYVTLREAKNEYLYNGKMFQDELGLDWLDYGARMYNPQIGRWSVIDPLAEKYPTITPYAYAGNNPIIFIDPDGREINVTFKGEGSEELYRRIINQILNNQFEVTLQAVKGKVNTFKVGIKATKGGGDVNKLSEGGQSFYNAFNTVIKSKTVVNLDVFNGSDKVAVGNYKDNAIDVADMNQFAEFNNNTNEQLGATKQGKMIHETREQFFKAIKGQEKGSMKYINSAHQNAVDFENKTNGNTRLPEKNPGKGLGIVEQYRRANGTVVRLQLVGGPNSPTRSVIVVKPYNN